jgi:hypothetical protein
MDASKVATLRGIVDELASLNKQVKELKASRTEIEALIIADMAESGLTLARTDFGTISTRKSIVASVTDWETFEDYIYENKALYLMQRRTSEPAYRELLESGIEVPGVEPFEKTTVGLTNVTT